MTSNVTQLILKVLASSDDYITSYDISKKINVSRSTIMDHMNEVNDYILKHGYVLDATKGRGYKIVDKDINFKRIISDDSLAGAKQYSKERFYYVLYLLISDNDSCRIVELTQILNISRPSVYKLIEEIDQWLLKYDVKLVKTRNKGIVIDSGEKRKRLVLVHWYLECNCFVQSLTYNEHFNDYFKLQRFLSEVITTKDEEKVVEMINDIRYSAKLDISKYDYQVLSTIIQISLLRIKNNQFVKMTEERINQIKYLDKNNILEYIRQSILVNFNINLIDNETIFIYTLIINSSTLMGSDTYQLFDINEEMIEQIKSYIRSQLLVDESVLSIFVDNFRVVITKELLIQIKENYHMDDVYYQQVLTEFKLVSGIANKIIDIISKYYLLANIRSLSANLVYMIWNIIESSLLKLKTLLYHDCNSIELAHIRNKINKYFVYLDLLDTSSIKLPLDDYDLVLTTIQIEQNEQEKEFIKITKMLGCQEVNSLSGKINNIYQKTNYNRIVKNKDKDVFFGM